MKIRESEQFVPTVDLNASGDHLTGMVKEVKYVNTKYGELPVVVFIDADVSWIVNEELTHSSKHPEVQMWASRKGLRLLTSPDFLGAWIDIVCRELPDKTKRTGYVYDIKKTSQSELPTTKV